MDYVTTYATVRQVFSILLNLCFFLIAMFHWIPWDSLQMVGGITRKIHMFGIPVGPVRRKILIHGMDRFHFLFQQNRTEEVTNREREREREKKQMLTRDILLMGAGPATGCRSAQMNDGQVAVNKQSFLSDITHSMFYKRHPIRDIVLILERLRDRL